MGSEPFESETPPERISSFEFSPDARDQRDEILAKTRVLLDLAARYLAGQRQSKRQTEESIQVERGHILLAAEILFTPESDQRLPWLSDFVQSLPFHSCFISYTEKDSSFSERLHNDLQAAGVRCWEWKKDAKWGKSIWGSVKEALRLYDKVVVICSRHSLKAPPVLEEIEEALQKEDDLIRSGKPAEVLCPITLDDFIFKKWQHERKGRVLKKHVGDFRKWKAPASYQTALKRLIHDLAAEPAASPKK